MMWNSRTAARWAAALFFFAATIGSLSIADGFSCGFGERMINSVKVSTSDVGDCGTMIGLSVDHYHPEFVADCKRWLDDTHADFVSTYHVDWCNKLDDGSLLYNASICCQDTTDNSRCFERYNFIDDEEVMDEAHAVKCEDDQVCQTQVRYEAATGDAEGFTAIRSTFCADPEVCYESANNNQVLCSNSSTVDEVQCNYCCEGLFCNYIPHSAPVYVGDNPCLLSACENDAECTADTGSDLGYSCICPEGFAGQFCETDVNDPCNPNPCINSGKCYPPKAQDTVLYRCACRTGWGGTKCEIAYPLCAEGNDYCTNGGQCYDQGENGFRCKCPDGFIGTRCERNELQCFNEKSVRNGGYMTPETTDCSSYIINQEEKRNEKQQISACKAQMRDLYKTGRLYEDNVNGPSLLLEARSFASCESGDWRSFVQNRYCCPSCFSLPCQNNGWCTQKDDGDYVCRCRAGWYGKNCELKQNICTMSGDTHYRQFDGRLVSFQGIGDFTLVESINQSSPDAFHVYGTNTGDGLVSYMTGMTVEICGQTVEFLKGSPTPVVMVDSLEINPFDYFENDCFRIYMDGNFVRLEAKTSSALVVAFNGDSTGYAQLDSSMIGKVYGICGFFDGDNSNDFRLRDRDVEDLGDLLERINEFGLGWSVTESASVPDPSPCEDLQDNIDVHCQMIIAVDGPFAECFTGEDIDPSVYEKACGLDVCAGSENKEKAACDSMANVALICFNKGYTTNWREATGCGLECPAGLDPLLTGPACHASCQNPDAETLCTNPSTDVCRCPEGLIRNGEECVEPSTCGCVTLEGQKYELEDSWITEDCSKQVVCSECTECDYAAGKLYYSPYICPENHYCQVASEGRGQCIQKPQCPEGQYFKQSATACPATCSNPTAPDSCTEPEREGCVCPEGLLLLDGACVESSECTCEGGTRQIGEQWTKNYICETKYECDGGEVKESPDQADCEEIDEKPSPSIPCIVSDCNQITAYFDSKKIGVNDMELPVIVGREYILAANTTEKSLIVLSKMGPGDVVESVACVSATHCQMRVVVTVGDAVFDNIFVKVVVSQGLMDTHIISRLDYPLHCPGDVLEDDSDCKK